MLVEDVGERVAEADDGVIAADHVTTHPAPVGLHGLQYVAALAGILECLAEHLRAAIHAGHVETGAHQLHGVEASTAGGVDHWSATVTFQYVDEEVAFAGRASVPIDQFIPALHEVVDIFVLVMIGFADFGWGFAEILFALKHCIDSDIATHAHIPPLRPSALVRAVILFKW